MRRNIKEIAPAAWLLIGGSVVNRFGSFVVPFLVLYLRKQGFSIPAAAWLRGDLQPFAREVLSPEAVARQGFFRPEAVTALIDAHTAGREDLSRQLWGLLAFTLWHERYGVGAENAHAARI